MSIVKPCCPRLQCLFLVATKITSFPGLLVISLSNAASRFKVPDLAESRGMHIWVPVPGSPFPPCSWSPRVKVHKCQTRPKVLFELPYCTCRCSWQLGIMILRTLPSRLEAFGSPPPIQGAVLGEAVVGHLSQPPPARQPLCCQAHRRQMCTVV